MQFHCLEKDLSRDSVFCWVYPGSWLPSQVKKSSTQLAVTLWRVYLFNMFDSSAAGESPTRPYKKVLISRERGVHLGRWQLSRDELSPDCTFPWSIHKEILRGGKQEGVDIIRVDNGLLCFTLIPTRGMGLLNAHLNGLRLGWDSPIKEIVHPHFVNLESRGGLGWLEGFNEWVVRCGLEFAGAPGKDTFITNTGDEAAMDLTLHGKIANIPASEVEALIDNEPPHLIKITGRVDERVFFGPQLELKTEISTIPGSNRINLKDSVTNRSSASQEFQLIYHCNYGAPLLEEGSRFVAPVKRVWPINDHSAPLIDKFDVYSGPIRGFVEQVYCIDPLADENGFSAVMLRNRSSDKAVVMTFSLEQLPCLTLWKNTTEIENGYVTGIEPGTSFPYNRRVERGHGRVPELEPGETRTFEIDFTVLDSTAQVADQASQIEKVQAKRKPEMFRSPPKVG